MRSKKIKRSTEPSRQRDLFGGPPSDDSAYVAEETAAVYPEEGAEAAEVAVESPLRRTFTYLVPEKLRGKPTPGARLLVPFGARLVAGYYLGPVALPVGEDGPRKLKPIAKILDHVGTIGATGTAPVSCGQKDGRPPAAHDAPPPALTPELLVLGRWVARRWACSLGTTLASFLPAGVKSGRTVRRVRFVRLLKSAAELRHVAAEVSRRAPRRAELLRAAAELSASAEGEGTEPKTLIPMTEFPPERRGAATWRAPVAAGLVSLEECEIPPTDEFTIAADEEEMSAPPVLTDEQAAVWRELEPALPKSSEPVEGEGGVFLLHGVTGSGKTELYLRALEKVLERGRTGIVLVPEISLTPQTARRFHARLGAYGVAVLHSRQTAGERAAVWRAVRRGELRVVVGPRSALFAPLARLGLVVVDEEHETSFKQEAAPRYHVRETAWRRARQSGAALVFGSATPSLETWRAAATGRIGKLSLRRRVAGRPLPRTVVVDMLEERREMKRETHFSRVLCETLEETLAKGEQALLFLNRRGFAPILLCRKCGHVEKCERCDVTLTVHKQRGVLRCHYCAAERRPPPACPVCGDVNLRRTGLGTERVEEELCRLFPKARLARMDADTVGRRGAWTELLESFRTGETDVLVGTQMIAKGLDFPNVTLAAVISADTALHLPDFRARERTFQLLTQVTGRTGRGEKGGKAIIQTELPRDPAVRAAARHDYEGFAARELKERRAFGYPPFTRLARVLVRSPEGARAAEAARRVAGLLRPEARALGLTLLGPSTAPIARVEGNYRFHLLLKTAPAEASLSSARGESVVSAGLRSAGDPFGALFAGPAGEALERLRGAEVTIDVDPLDLL